VTDRVEYFVPPRKGARHGQRLLRDILFFEPSSPRTNLRVGLDTILRTQRRRAVVFLFSDFADAGYDQAIRRVGRRHDLVAISIRDPLEEQLPKAGLLQLRDAESGESRMSDSSDAQVRADYVLRRTEQRSLLARSVRAADANLIEVSTDGGHFDELVRFFRRRQRRRAT
jgi:uncharacterized protein (DUF58 family)